MSNQSMPDKAGVIVFPPLLYLLTLVTGLLLSYLFPHHLLPNIFALVIGVSMVLCAFLILRKAVRQLTKHKTAVNPSGATTTIVNKGIYRVTRNPMYVSFTLFHIGISIIFNAWLGLLLLFPLLIVVQKGVIEREETYLAQKFGNEYLIYKANVRRWL